MENGNRNFNLFQCQCLSTTKLSFLNLINLEVIGQQLINN